MSVEKGSIPADKIMGESTRLRIVSYLAGSSVEKVSFSRLKEELELTSGNLSVQLRRLEKAGYVTITKRFKDRRPLTQVSLTPQGLKALNRYVRELEEMLSRVKKTAELKEEGDKKDRKGSR